MFPRVEKEIVCPDCHNIILVPIFLSREDANKILIKENNRLRDILSCGLSIEE